MPDSGLTLEKILEAKKILDKLNAFGTGRILTYDGIRFFRITEDGQLEELIGAAGDQKLIKVILGEENG